MRHPTLSLLLLLCATAMSAQTVTMTGLLDGTLSGGRPKGLELYVSGTVDLSGFAVERAANSATSFSSPQSLSGTYTDEFVYLTSTATEFAQVFGSGGDFANLLTVSNLTGNGDDRFRLVRTSDGSVVDQTGGETAVRASIYRDSYLYRVDGTGPDGAWVAANWDAPGNDALDGLDAAGIRAAVPFGTYVPANVGPTVSVTSLGDLAEPSTDGGFRVALNQAATADVTVGYQLSGTATAGADFTDASAGAVTIAAGDLSADVTFAILDDNVSEPAETIVVDVTAVSDASYDFSGASVTLSVIDDEPLGVTGIHAVQGSGATSPLQGTTVQIEGVVVGDFQGDAAVGLGGFFLQEQDAEADNDPATSEGIWVYQNPSQTFVDVAEGDVVTVTGEVLEFGGLTEIVPDASAGAVTVTGTAALPSVTTIALPTATRDELERYEGMRVTFTTPLVVTSTFDLARFGSITASTPDRLIQFTECNEPDASALAAYEADQALRTLIVDDGRSGQNIDPIALPTGGTLSATNTLRAGTSLQGLTGVLDERFTGYRLQPTTPATRGTENPRPTAAPAVGGDLQIASINVLNYFNGDGQGGGFPTSRGARDAAAFARQQAKLVAAICELDAAAVGLVEIENDGYGPNSALQTLVDAIAAECGTVYDFVEAPSTGTDEIQVAIIYQPARLTEDGTAAALTSPTDVFSRNRVPVAQTFRVVEGGSASFGESLTLVVNHFKSKGGSCGAGDDADDGSGSCDGSRTAAAAAIRDWLATNPTGTTDPDYLVVGDLNAYRKEAPIDVFVDAGYVNTVVDAQPAGAFPCGGAPSFVFRGEWGALDYILASPTLATQVTGADAWAVNAAEPRPLDYNDDGLYAADFYRFSDHDPLSVGLSLGQRAVPVEMTGFDARRVAGAVELAWATAAEEGTSHFEVQRQLGADDFEAIGQVAARGRAAEYGFRDVAAPQAGTLLYRLRIVEEDGSAAFSDVVAVGTGASAPLRVARRDQTRVYLTGVSVGAELHVVDAMGRVYARQVFRSDADEVAVATDHLAPGLYVVRASVPGGRAESVRLVVQ